MVELKFTPVQSGGYCSSFAVKPYVRGQLTIGNDVIDVDVSITRYPRLKPIALSNYSYTDVTMILGQDFFHAIRPPEYFETDRQNTPVAVRLQMNCVLIGALPSTTGSPTDAKATKNLDETTYHYGSRYKVGKLSTDDESCLLNNYFSAVVQMKSTERRLQKDAELKASHKKTISDDFSKDHTVLLFKWKKQTVLKQNSPVYGICRAIRSCILTNLAKTVGFSMELQNFMVSQ